MLLVSFIRFPFLFFFRSNMATRRQMHTQVPTQSQTVTTAFFGSAKTGQTEAIFHYLAVFVVTFVLTAVVIVISYFLPESISFEQKKHLILLCLFQIMMTFVMCKTLRDRANAASHIVKLATFLDHYENEDERKTVTLALVDLKSTNAWFYGSTITTILAFCGTIYDLYSSSMETTVAWLVFILILFSNFAIVVFSRSIRDRTMSEADEQFTNLKKEMKTKQATQ